MPSPVTTASRFLLVLTTLALLATLVLPVWPAATTELAVLGLLGGGVAVLRLRQAREPRPAPLMRGERHRHRRARRQAHAHGAKDLALYLSPVLLLSIAYPFAVTRMDGSEVGGTALPTLLLASSLTVPWLSVAVCLPLYRSVGHLLPDGDPQEITARFCSVWPATFAQTAPVALLFAIPLQVAVQWSPTAWLTYVALCLLHALFAQSLVLANIGRRRLVWSLAWVGYAAALVLLPTFWFLPPLVGLATQLPFVRPHLPRLASRARLEHADVGVDMLKGLLLGAVLWAHFLLLFVKTSGQFAVNLMFVGAFASVAAYNYYFVRLAPGFDRAVLRMRSAMENEPHARVRVQSELLARVVDASLQRTAAVCAVLGLLVTAAAQHLTHRPLPLVAVVAVASWLFMMITLACYKLDYIGHGRQSQVISGAHLALSAVAFLLVPFGVALYGWLIAISITVFAVALRACRARWGSPEYALFWRHATAW